MRTLEKKQQQHTVPVQINLAFPVHLGHLRCPLQFDYLQVSDIYYCVCDCGYYQVFNTCNNIIVNVTECLKVLPCMNPRLCLIIITPNLNLKTSLLWKLFLHYPRVK